MRTLQVVGLTAHQQNSALIKDSLLSKISDKNTPQMRILPHRKITSLMIISFVK